MDLPPLRIQMPPDINNLPYDSERPDTPDTPRPGLLAPQVQQIPELAPLIIRLNDEQLEKYNNDECIICTDRYNQKSITLINPCTHIIHTECITRWTNLGNHTCPKCRGNIQNIQQLIIDQTSANNPAVRFAGGGMNYLEKYKKYKSKYLQLKNIK